MDDIQLIDYASRIAGLAIERERSESALTLALEKIRKSEAQLKQIVDVIPQGIAVIDPDGAALYANQWLLDYCGLGLDEILADMELRSQALRRQARAAERYRKLSDQIRIAAGCSPVNGGSPVTNWYSTHPSA